MFITLINDSCDDNAKARQKTRWSILFPESNISFTGVDSRLDNAATLEAAGNLIDLLDASEGKSGIIAVNVAPRGDKKDGENGTPFGYFHYKQTLVVSTTKSSTLSLVKKFGLIDKINLLNTEEVLNYAKQNNLITKRLSIYIAKSQFRSFDFQPRVARWLIDGLKIPSQELSVEKVSDAPSAIWLIDSFGNAKTTLTKNDLPLKGSPIKVRTNIGEFNCYNRLKDIPDGETAIYIGSSGIGDKRFLEIATQGREGSVTKTLNLKVGDKIELLENKNEK